MKSYLLDTNILNQEDKEILLGKLKNFNKSQLRYRYLELVVTNKRYMIFSWKSKKLRDISTEELNYENFSMVLDDCILLGYETGMAF